MTMKRMYMALALIAAVLAGQCAMAQEQTGHYSGTMDIESQSAARLNDGSGTPVLLEDLDQSTVNNVLRRATRPEAADLVWEMIEKGNIGTAPKDIANQRASNVVVERPPLVAPERPATRPAPPRAATRVTPPVAEKQTEGTADLVRDQE